MKTQGPHGNSKALMGIGKALMGRARPSWNRQGPHGKDKMKQYGMHVPALNKTPKQKDPKKEYGLYVGCMHSRADVFRCCYYTIDRT